MERNQASPSEGFKKQMLRLFGNWTVGDEELRTVKAKEFREAFDRVGEERFTTGVTEVIWNHRSGFFPTLGEFMSYVPDPKPTRPPDSWYHTPEEWADIERENNTPEVRALRAQIDALIKGKSVAEVLRQQDAKRDADRVEHERKIAEARRQA